jgi:hypothetical protein
MDVVPTEYATAYPNSVLRDSLALLTKVRGFCCYCELFDFYPCALRFRMRRRYKGGRCCCTSQMSEHACR